MTQDQNNFFQQNETEAITDDALQKNVTKVIQISEIPAHIKGYRYLRFAIVKSIHAPDLTNAITKTLYPEIAKAFKTKASCAERSIRHAISVAWKRGGYDGLNTVFGCPIWNKVKKPTNSEFIAAIADHIRLELKVE